MIEAPDFLPLGSVVRLQGSEDKRFVVVGRALAINNPESNGAKEYFDYAVSLYPEGIVGDAVIYTNHDCITEVVFRGYSDGEDERLVEMIREVLLNVFDIPKANPVAQDEW